MPITAGRPVGTTRRACRASGIGGPQHGNGFPRPVPNRRNKSTTTAAVETPAGATAVHDESTAVSDRFVVVDHAPPRLPAALLSHPSPTRATSRTPLRFGPALLHRLRQQENTGSSHR